MGTNFFIVSTIRLLLDNLIYEQGIKFWDLLRNNNKLFDNSVATIFFFTNCEILHFLWYDLPPFSTADGATFYSIHLGICNSLILLDFSPLCRTSKLASVLPYKHWSEPSISYFHVSLGVAIQAFIRTLYTILPCQPRCCHASIHQNPLYHTSMSASVLPYKHSSEPYIPYFHASLGVAIQAFIRNLYTMLPCHPRCCHTSIHRNPLAWRHRLRKYCQNICSISLLLISHFSLKNDVIIIQRVRYTSATDVE